MASPSIRRIQADIRELSRHPSDQYAAEPSEDDMFNWHFVIRGPSGTDFEGGIYHGRIVLPADYPFKPPAIMFLTPNGRWKVREKICLSISNYHPEQWQPAWGIRTILEALISFMNVPGEGAVGALDCTSEVRRQMAIESRSYTHPEMPKLPELKADKSPDAVAEDEETQKRYKEQISMLHEFNLGQVNENDTQKENDNVDVRTETASSPEVKIHSDQVPESFSSTNEQTLSNHAATTAPINQTNSAAIGRSPAVNDDNDAIDSWLERLSVGLIMVIFAILYRKALHLYT